jgi:hypothetical protein
MFRYLFLCLLLVCVSLGQSNRSSSPPPELKPRPSSPNAETPGTSSSTVAPDAPVITVQGLCEKPAGLSSNPADCKTLVTKAEFEKLTGPNMAPAQRKALADQYVKALVLEKKAQEQGLDRGPEFDQQMKIARLKILANLEVQQLQKDAGNVPDNEIEDYYHQHLADYKTITFDRLYVPKQKVVDPSTQKPNDPDAEKKRAASETEMKEEADKLRTRAGAGEDFTKLQQEAYDFAGLKQKAASPRQENVRRNGVQPADASIFELKSGEVSRVFNDPTGFMIYKIEETKDLSLENVRDEITRALQSEKMKNSFDSLTNSAKTTLDENYFATPAPPTLKKPGEAPTAQTPPPGKK